MSLPLLPCATVQRPRWPPASLLRLLDALVIPQSRRISSQWHHMPVVPSFSSSPHTLQTISANEVSIWSLHSLLWPSGVSSSPPCLYPLRVPLTLLPSWSVWVPSPHPSCFTVGTSATSLLRMAVHSEWGRSPFLPTLVVWYRPTSSETSGLPIMWFPLLSRLVLKSSASPSLCPCVCGWEGRTVYETRPKMLSGRRRMSQLKFWVQDLRTPSSAILCKLRDADSISSLARISRICRISKICRISRICSESVWLRCKDGAL